MADLSCFATQEQADEGVIFPVKLYGKKIPVALKIFGSDSDVVQEYEKEKLRKIRLNKKGDIDDEVIEDFIDSQEEAVLIRLGGVYSYDWKKNCTTDEPVTIGSIEIKNDKKSYKTLLDSIPALKDFITEKSNERTNFLSDGKKN